MDTGRRIFLQQVAAGAAAAVIPVRGMCANPTFASNPFSLGIASGDPTDQSIILWTRLAPDPLAPGGGMADLAVPVRWQVARDKRFRRLVREGIAIATPDLAHSVHVDVQGLDQKTQYWYRFSAGDAESKVGRTRTLAAPGTQVSAARFTTCSCQHFEQGYFTAYAHMIEDAPDFVVHLGDYIYEVSFGSAIRSHIDNSPVLSIDDFRTRHALYKSDPDLQAAHRVLPFFAVPDNHDALPDDDPTKYSIRSAAYQAWYEHMPVRAWYRLGSAALSAYQSVDVGSLLRLNLLDTRQFRTHGEISEGDPNYAFGIFKPDVPERHDVNRSMLGVEQMRWLSSRLKNSPAAWNAVASTVPVGEFEFRRNADPTSHYYYSSWDGFPANRNALFDSLRATENPVVLSGDIHSFWAKELNLDPDDKAKKIATEFVTSSISAGWPEPLSIPVSENLSRNPTTRLYEPAYRGYTLHDVTADAWTTTMRAVESVKVKNSGSKTIATFRITTGEGRATQI